ncbi:CVNH domain-containing protein [Microdochium nivale]|nr:CVNH domain-containing protein [Microdochium nivale]
MVTMPHNNSQNTQAISAAWTTIFMSFFLLLGLSVAPSSSIVAAQEFGGGFMTNCTWQGAQFDTERGLLEMYCNNDNWVDFDYGWTELDTSLCFGDNGGKLIPLEEGRYFESCELCNVDNGITKTQYLLTCHCWGTEGQFEETTIDLNQTIWNHDGTLGCFSQSGKAAEKQAHLRSGLLS